MEHEHHDIFVEETIQKALNAAHSFGKLDQEQTDRIVHAIYETGFNHNNFFILSPEFIFSGKKECCAIK